MYLTPHNQAEALSLTGQTIVRCLVLISEPPQCADFTFNQAPYVLISLSKGTL